MDGAEKDFAGLVILLFKIGFDGVGQRGVAGFVALHNLSCGLVDDDEVVVFVENFHNQYEKIKACQRAARRSTWAR